MRRRSILLMLSNLITLQRKRKAYAAEHNARQHSDSALALALSMHSDAPPHSRWKRDVMLVIDGALLAKYGPALLRGLAHLHPHL